MFKNLFSFIREEFHEEIAPLHAPCFSGNETKYLSECIRSTMVSSVGQMVPQFEKAVADFTGSRYAIAVVNGTAALHISLKLAEVVPQSEVLTQALTFVATANAISYCGAIPHFLDVDSSTMGMSPYSLEAFLSTQTKQFQGKCINENTGRVVSACLPMHTCGHPCRIREITEICNHFNIPVIEDSAESLGSLYHHRHTGTFGLLGAISFNGNKIITTGGGGIILTNDETLAKKAHHITTTAKVNHPSEFIHDEIGYNFRMPNLNAALGLAQIEQLDQFIDQKRKLSLGYQHVCEHLPIHFFAEPPDCRSNYWLNTLILEKKEHKSLLLTEAHDNKISARSIWRPMHLLDIYKKCPKQSLETTEHIYTRAVNIPSGVRNTT